MTELIETKLPGDAAEIRRIYSAILSVDGTHHGALRGLERLALLAADRALLADVDGRYARAESDAGVVAGHQTRLGESLDDHISLGEQRFDLRVDDKGNLSLVES